MKDRRIHRLRVEGLESRDLLAGLVVTNTLSSGAGSLRQSFSDQNDPAMADNSTVSRRDVSPLSIAITNYPAAPVLGGVLSYVVAVKNSGPTNLNGVILIDELPVSAIYESSFSSQGTQPIVTSGTLGQTSTKIEEDFGTIAAGQTGFLNVLVSLTDIGPITNNASSTDTGEINPVSVKASLTINVGTGITPVLKQAPADFDGSGKTNLAIYLPSIGAFAVRPTQGPADLIIPFGIPGANQTIPAPGDYTGVGHTEIAAYLPTYGVYAIRPLGGVPDQVVPFGIPGPGQSIPVTGDYDGTGRDNIAVYLPAFGEFAIRPIVAGPDRIIPFGIPGIGQSIPAPGDYFGTGQTDLAVYLPAFGAFAIRPPIGPDQIIPFGIPGAGQSIPIPGDYDGSGRTELAVYLPALGVFAYRPTGGGPDVQIHFGAAGDRSIPVPGDYDGSGHDEIAVYDPNYATFGYRPSKGNDVIVAFGATGIGQSIPLAASPSLSPAIATATSLASPVPTARVTGASAVPTCPALASRRATLTLVAQAITEPSRSSG